MAGDPELEEPALSGAASRNGWAGGGERASPPGTTAAPPRPIHRTLEQLAASLAGVRERFDGDLDSCLIYLIVAAGHLATPPEFPAHFPEGGQGRRRTGINILSISEITRIPRETVRRKLNLLAAQEYLTRGEDHLYYIRDESRLREFLKDIDNVLAAPSRRRPA